MEEPDLYEDDPGMRQILDATRNAIQDPRTSQGLRVLLFGAVQLIDAEISGARQAGNIAAAERLAAIAEAAFALGAIAGTPAMVTKLRAGKRAAGGLKSGAARKAKAELRRAHAVDLRRDILARSPGLSQEAVAAEVRERWKLNTEPPGISALVKMLRDLKRRN